MIIALWVSVVGTACCAVGIIVMGVWAFFKYGMRVELAILPILFLAASYSFLEALINLAEYMVNHGG